MPDDSGTGIVGIVNQRNAPEAEPRMGYAGKILSGTLLNRFHGESVVNGGGNHVDGRYFDETSIVAVGPDEGLRFFPDFDQVRDVEMIGIGLFRRFYERNGMVDEVVIARRAEGEAADVDLIEHQESENRKARREEENEHPRPHGGRRLHEQTDEKQGKRDGGDKRDVLRPGERQDGNGQATPQREKPNETTLSRIIEDDPRNGKGKKHRRQGFRKQTLVQEEQIQGKKQKNSQQEG